MGLDSLPLRPPSVKLSTLLFLLYDLQADWILELANQNSTIIGVVGWVDLTDPQVNKIFKFICEIRQITQTSVLIIHSYHAQPHPITVY